MKLAMSALLCALRGRNFVLISLLSDGEGAIALCTAVMRSLGAKFNPLLLPFHWTFYFL